jgi:hypothetical protein
MFTRTNGLGDRQEAQQCRLCLGPTQFRFRHRILLRYDTAYFECERCGSLQTSPPHWLTEAYSFGGSTLDVGTALRPLQNWLLLAAAFQACGLPKTARYIDFGGNSGLFTQLMRYSGYRFECFDRYTKPFFADYHHLTELGAEEAFLVTAFEVLEHFAEPRQELDALFATQPALVITSTQLWQGQGADWGYLAPACGQHVFFYGEAGLRDLALRHGYDLVLGRSFQFFARKRERSPAISELLTSLPMAELKDEDILATAGSVVRGNDYIAQDSAEAVAQFVRNLEARTEPKDSLRAALSQVRDGLLSLGRIGYDTLNKHRKG